MTEQELKKFKQPVPKGFPVAVRDARIEDEYGIYETGMYMYKGMKIIISIDDGKWHLSVSAKFPLGYQQLKDVRYKFLPNAMHIAQIFPPREQFVNIHTCLWHLWEIDFEHE